MGSRIAALIISLTMLASVAHGEKWAIIVGINDYEDPGLPDLRYGVQDAKLVHKVLTQAPDGFGPGNVILLTDDQPDVLRRPTRSGIIRFLTTWFAEPVAGDTILFYFAGHGAESQGQSFLLPSDATLANPGLTGLQLEMVKECLRQCKAEKKVLVVDSCHSGAGRDVGVMGATTAQTLFEKAKGLVTLASCGQEERSYEWDEKGQGAFSYFLAEGLLGAADRDGDRSVVTGELNWYVWDQTRKWAARRGFKQHPKYVSAVQGDITLAGVSPGGTRASLVAPISTTAALAIRGAPVGADLYIDGRECGHIPTELTLDLGPDVQREVEVVAQKAGYRSAAAKVTLRRGEVSRWDVDLVAVRPPPEPAHPSGDKWEPPFPGHATLRSGETISGAIKLAEWGVVIGSGVGSVRRQGGLLRLHTEEGDVDIQAVSIHVVDVEWRNEGTEGSPAWRISEIRVTQRDGAVVTGQPTWLLHCSTTFVELANRETRRVLAFPPDQDGFTPDNFLARLVCE